MNGTSSRAWTWRPQSFERFSTGCRSCRRAAGAWRAAKVEVPAALALPTGRSHVDAAGLRPDPERARARHGPALAERIVTTAPDVTVSTNLGAWVNRRGLFARESTGGHFQEGEDPLHLRLGILAQGPAYRARHRRDEPVHPALGARPVAFDQRRAPAADRHALRSLHPARPRCAELCLLPGCPLHGGGDALGHHAGAGGRRASVDRHAADRHRAGRARRLRAGLRRRARRDHALGLRLHAARRRGRSRRDHLAARPDRRLGLSAALDPPASNSRGRDDDAPNSPAISSTAPIGCASRARMPGRGRLYGRASRRRRSRPSA